MRSKCPLCGVSGNIPDHALVRPNSTVKCRKCGAKFSLHVPESRNVFVGKKVDVKELEVASSFQYGKYAVSIILSIVHFLVKYTITAIAVFMHVFVLLFCASRIVLLDRDARINTDSQSVDFVVLGVFGIFSFFILIIPLLGAYVAKAKKRGFAEGYNLTVFFGPIGLLVALCLPNLRKS